MNKLIILYSVLAVAFARMGNSIDSSSYGNIEEVRTSSVHLSLTVSFDDKTFTGSAFHGLEILKNNTDGVYFDVVGIDIVSVV